MKRIAISICLSIFMITAVIVATQMSALAGSNILLWNKLGSAEQIAHSEIGPDGTIYKTIEFVPGRFGNGFRSSQGRGKSGVNFGLWEDINPDYDQAGTVEFWWRPNRDYNEGNSAPDELFVSGLWCDPFNLPFQLMYRWRESPEHIGGFAFLVTNPGIGNHNLYTGKVAPFYAGDWVHVAFVWDMDGLPNHPEVLYGAFINGQYYPLVDAHHPGATINYPMPRIDDAYFSMGYYDMDINNQQQGVIDNVIIWDGAKTEFSHRFDEYPGNIVLWNKLGSAEQISHSEIGPDGTIYQTVDFVPGRFGNGFRSSQGRGKSGVNFGLWEDINPDYDQAGTVEFWWRPNRDYNEGNSAPDELFVSGLWCDPFNLPFQLMYRWRESPEHIGGFDFQVTDPGIGSHYLYTGKVAPFYAGDWVHVAFVWDMDGLPNHPEVFYGAFINGQYYPLVDAHHPGATINYPMPRIDDAYYSMGYYDMDINNQQQGVIDNVMVWDHAKTDFTHCLDESACTRPLPAPLLVSPENGVENVSRSPTLTWHTVAGALSYHLSVYDAALNTIVDQAGLTTAYYNIPVNILNEGETYLWQVTAVNGCGQDGEKPDPFDFTTSSSASPSLTVLSPNGGEFLIHGTNHEIRWKYSGDCGNYLKIEYNTGGRRWITIVPNAVCSYKSYMWAVPAEDCATCRIRITAVNDSSLTDISDNNFKIGEYIPRYYTACHGNNRYWYDNRNMPTVLAQTCTAPQDVIQTRKIPYSHGESCSGKGCIHHDRSICYSSYCEADQCKVHSEQCTIIEECDIGYCANEEDEMYCAVCDSSCIWEYPYGLLNARCGPGGQCIRSENCR